MPTSLICVTCPQCASRAGAGWPAVGPWGTAPAPSLVPTCAAEGHGAHSSQVDGISLVMGEELQPHITDADEEEGAQGQEVACGSRSQRGGSEWAGGRPSSQPPRRVRFEVPSLFLLLNTGRMAGTL